MEIQFSHLVIIFLMCIIIFVKIKYSKYTYTNSPKRIIIVGKAGSGKDYLKQLLIDKGFIPDISFTTRPIRKGEIRDVTYHYVEEEDFEQDIANRFFHQYDNFNGWYYGTSRESWINNNIFIMTPGGIAKLSEEDVKSSFIIYLDIDENIRRERLAMRSDADTVERRVLADERDFKDFKTYTIRIDNPSF